MVNFLLETWQNTHMNLQMLQLGSAPLEVAQHPCILVYAGTVVKAGSAGL